ncbi:MAG TPA: YceI family protein [Chitinophaga sp.]|uniref:YceI family protein n=1 Tax=Chitinophaga sp. TaxID=1869181 RepID=UPI002DC04BA6|nr:YceI family protein [Chitinophaga sp.]HEU4551467.1 YceI family protein [Chitinophaga sp.]
MKRLTVTLAAVTFVIASAFTYATSWKIADGYTIKFEAKGASGSFSGLKGEIVFDPEDLPGSRFNVTISTASINTNNGLKNKHAKGEKYLYVKKYPLIRFTSSAVKQSGNGYVASGTLEIRGVKKEVSLPFSFSKTDTGGLFTGNITVNREDYQVGSSSFILGSDFKVTISVPVKK